MAQMFRWVCEKKSKFDFLLIFGALLIMVFGQVMVKTGASHASFFNVFVVMGYAALLVRGLLWIAVLNRMPVSFAYPVMSVSFVLILLVSYYLFNEAITVNKLLGSGFIILGVILTSMGKSKEEV